VLIAVGIVQAIGLLTSRNHPSFWLSLIPAVLGIVVGFLLINNVGQGMVTITVLLILFLMIEGISKVVFALTIRPLTNWFWVLASGILGIVLSVMLWTSMPDPAVWLIGLLVGIHLVGEGLALGGLVWQAGKE
jgi:uncharacterized membrane protein HdeD (DUF308 family)